MNTFQQEKDTVNLNYLSACMKKFNTEFLGEVGDLKGRQNKVLKDHLNFCWKP